MTPNTPVNGFWSRLLLVLLPLMLVGLVAYGSLKSDVAHTREDVATKASRETVVTEYESIKSRLDDISQRLERIEARR